MGGITKQLGQDTVGNVVGAAVGAMAKEAQIAQLQKQVDRLTKLVHILWKEAERLESVVKLIPEGLQIKAGMSEILVLRNGGIILDGHRILLKTPGKDQLMF